MSRVRAWFCRVDSVEGRIDYLRAHVDLTLFGSPNAQMKPAGGGS